MQAVMMIAVIACRQVPEDDDDEHGREAGRQVVKIVCLGFTAADARLASV